MSTTRNLELSELIKIISYERGWFFNTFALVSLLGALVIYCLPSVYTVSSELMLEQQGTYSSHDSTNKENNYSNKINYRMHALIKNILTTENIVSLLNETDVLNEQADQKETLKAVKRFKKNTRMEFDIVEIIIPADGREGKYSSGIKIEHDSRSADTAYKTVEHLVEQMMAGSIGKMVSADERQIQFLKDKYDTALYDVERAEELLAQFKHDNATFLPEHYSIAVKRHEDLKERLKQSDERLRSYGKKEHELHSDIAISRDDAFLYAPDGARVVGPEEKLIALETEYATKKANYSNSHPEVINLKKEITALKTFVKSRDSTGVEVELKQARSQLLVAADKYTNEHPDVIKLRTKVDSLEKQLASIKPGGPHAQSKPTNPEYVRLISRLDGLEEDAALEKRINAQLHREVKENTLQLQRIPFVEKELESIDRKVKLARSRYERIEKDLIESDLAHGMNTANLLDRVTLIEPPIVPLKPSKPNKLILMAVLAIIAFALAYLFAMMAYGRNEKIYDSGVLGEIIGSPIYTIPQFK